MKRITFSKVAQIDRSVASDHERDTLPYVGLDDIAKGEGRFAADFTRKPEPLLATKFKFSRNHVLYGKLRPYLNKVALPSFEGVCTTEILPLLPNPKRLDKTYLWAYLLTPQFVDWASRIVSGANLPRLSPKDLAQHEIPLPPLEEQKRIAGILARADRVRQLRRYALQLSDGYLQSVFLRMFGEKMSQSSIPLGEVLLESPKNGLYLPAEKYGRGTPIVRINNFYAGVLGKPNTFKRVQASLKEIEQFRLLNNEILINRVNSIEYLGKCALVQGLQEDTVFESNMMRLRVNRKFFSPTFIVHFLASRHAYVQILKRAKKAVNQASINQTDVKTIKIPDVPLSLQNEFASIVNGFRKLEAQQREAIRQADHLFDTLLHRAFRGEL